MNQYFIKLLLLFCLSLVLSAEDKKLQEVTLQLQWKHQFEFAGFYAAIEKGFYKDVGLDVKLIEFDKDQDITQEVLNGNADYGLSYSSIIADYYNGEPLVFMANFFKQSPIVLITQKEITTPRELKGKKIMGLSDSIHSITLLSMLDKFDVKMKDIKNVKTNFRLDDFINKKVDAMSVFTTNELYTLNKKGISYNLFDPTVYGAKYYDSNLFTSEKELHEHPKRVKAFKEASIRGWEYALEHKSEVIEIILKKYNTQNKSQEALEFEANQVEYIMLPNVYEIGSIDITRVQTILDDFIQAGFIKKDKRKDIAPFIYRDKENPLGLTKEEKLFIKKHSEIVLGTEKRWEPMVIVGTKGQVTGYDADVLNLINNASGANFVLKAGDWAEMIKEAKSKTIDGLSTGGIHEERKKYLNFSDIYIEMQKMIIVSLQNPKNILTQEDLTGKTIAIHASNLVDVKIAQTIPNATILKFEELKDVLNSVASGEADATFGNTTTMYFATKLGIPYFKYVQSLDQTLSLAFGVRKDWPEAISIINKSLRYISQHKLLALKNKWFFQKYDYSHISFSNKELEYMNSKDSIRMCVDANWMPFEAYSDGKYKGINSDFIKIFEQDIPIPIRIIKTANWNNSMKALVENKCDILSLVSKTKAREEYLSFTTSYLGSNLVITAKVDKNTVLDVSHLEGKKIAVVKGYASAEILKDNYKNIILVEVETVEDGLKKLNNDEVYGYAGSAIVNEYYFKRGNYDDFKTIAYFDQKLSLSIAVKKGNKLLHSILEKVLLKLSDKEKQDIIKKWSYKNYTKNFDYDLFIKFLLAISAVIVFGLYRHSNIQKSNKALKRKIEEALKEAKDKDQMIFHQTKLIAMGEMIDNIAHQWRQPLSQVNSAVLLIDDLLYQKKIKDPAIEEKLLEIENLTQYMSKTINDFRDFFDKNKQQVSFNLNEPIQKAINILTGVMKIKHIDLRLELDSNAECYSYPNEIQQVVLVILNNAIDACKSNDIKDPYICIKTSYINDYRFIKISDNAGGISEDVITKIFEPYFTTKHKKQGAGIGLYLSKMIIEESLNGQLSVQNTDEGVEFTIKLKESSEY